MPRGIYERKPRHREPCEFCASDRTAKRGKYNRWYKIKNKISCQRCYTKLVDYPRVKLTKRRKIISYAGKQIQLSFNIRNHKCSECGSTIAKKYDMHHDFYIPLFPWIGTRELCQSCHLKQGWKDKVFTYNQYCQYNR